MKPIPKMILESPDIVNLPAYAILQDYGHQHAVCLEPHEFTNFEHPASLEIRILKPIQGFIQICQRYNLDFSKYGKSWFLFEDTAKVISLLKPYVVTPQIKDLEIAKFMATREPILVAGNTKKGLVIEIGRLLTQNNTETKIETVFGQVLTFNNKDLLISKVI